jgi:hypothetical protein
VDAPFRGQQDAALAHPPRGDALRVLGVDEELRPVDGVALPAAAGGVDTGPLVRLTVAPTGVARRRRRSSSCCRRRGVSGLYPVPPDVFVVQLVDDDQADGHRAHVADPGGGRDHGELGVPAPEVG